MAIAYNTSIVRDGLVLHLDAANRKSYPGSDTAWNDLSGSANIGTLTNGATYNSDNKGSFVFDGTDDFVNLGSTYFIATSSPFTVNLWVNPNWRSPNGSLTDFHRMVTLRASGTTTLGLAYVNQANSGYEGIYMANNTGWAKAKTSYHPPSNIWALLTLTYNGADSTNIANFNVYWNTVALTFNTLGVSTPAATTDNNYLGVRQPGDVQVFRGNMSNFQIYNKVLTAAEVRQNFEALRGRYGI